MINRSAAKIIIDKILFEYTKFCRCELLGQSIAIRNCSTKDVFSPGEIWPIIAKEVTVQENEGGPVCQCIFVIPPLPAAKQVLTEGAEYKAQNGNIILDYNEIDEQLQNFDRGQICQFAWLIGVRALPFLSTKRAFSYWPEKDRQDHLYSIFNALDICAGVMELKIAINTFETTNVAIAATRATDDDAYTAASAAYVAARTAVEAITRVTATGTAITARKLGFREVLYKDIVAIKTGDYTTLNNDTSVYGDTWQDFLDDLKAVGYGYWARLYENLFKKKFILDRN